VTSFSFLRTTLAVAGLVALATSCDGMTCTSYRCSELTDDPIEDQTVRICERDDGYVRLDDENGAELYECFCTVDSMKDAAATICAEGAVCRGAGSPCSGSGDCCAGLFCTVNTCG
jgi:hypothetical protein